MEDSNDTDLTRFFKMMVVSAVYGQLMKVGGKKYTKLHRLGFFLVFALGLIAYDLNKYLTSTCFLCFF